MVTFHLMSLLKKSIPNIRSPSKCVFNPKVLPVHLLLWVDKFARFCQLCSKAVSALSKEFPATYFGIIINVVAPYWHKLAILVFLSIGLFINWYAGDSRNLLIGRVGQFLAQIENNSAYVRVGCFEAILQPFLFATTYI